MSEPRFGVYVHWPFCASKCPYCDFNSHVRERIDEARFVRALTAELDHYALATPGRVVDTVFFGGGTPSRMAPESVAAILARIRALWPVAPDCEITLEANPNTAEQTRFQGFRDAGVNRLSIGIQALDDRALRALGRAHDASEARRAIDLARANFKRFSFDLIYARPGQGLDQWQGELADALALAGEHLSLYQLTIEPGTAFHAQHARGDLVLPSEEDGESLFLATQETLARAGMPAYEISNHARAGAECRHNLIYWRYEDYLGIGPGAHGRFARDGARLATRQERAPETWLAGVEARGHATAETTTIAPDEAGREALLMGLRLSEGIDPARFARQTGIALDAAIDARARARLIDQGFLEDDATRLRASAKGRAVLNALIASLSL